MKNKTTEGKGIKREIKFRAWLPDAKFEPGMYYQDNQYISSFLRRIYDKYTVTHPSYLKFELEERLMQYTGLKDKNDKEIYEGDIVRILYTDWASKPDSDKRTLEQYLIEDKCHLGTVVFNTPEFELDFGIGIYGDKDFGSFNYGTHGWIEVIGNIYENKNLLINHPTHH